ncbi:hypothetical protein ACLBX9_05295 [Methylobacterium sp. A49B]
MALPRFTGEPAPASIEAVVESANDAEHQVQCFTEERYSGHETRDEMATNPTEHAHGACGFEARPEAAQPTTRELELRSPRQMRPNGDLPFDRSDSGTPSVRSGAPPPGGQLEAIQWGVGTASIEAGSFSFK